MGLIKWVKDKWNKFKNTKFGRGLVKIGKGIGKVVKGVGKGIGKVWKTGLGIANAVNKSPLGGVLNGLTKGAFGAGVGIANTLDNIGGQVGQHVRGFVKGAEELTRPGTDKTATLHQMVDSGKAAAGGFSKIRDMMAGLSDKAAATRNIILDGRLKRTAVMPRPGLAVLPKPGLAIAPKAPPPVRQLIP